MDDDRTVKNAAALMRRSASMLNIVATTKGDDGQVISGTVEQLRSSAKALDVLALALRPTPGLLAWNKGTAEAAKDYRPGLPGKPS